MANHHIAIPRFIEEGFAVSGKVESYDFDPDRFRSSPTSKLGTAEDYYDQDVEKTLLANKVENEFSKLYKDITSTMNPIFIKCCLDNNKELVTQFFSFAFLRAKKSLQTINDNSLSSAVFGEMDHSELLRIQTYIQVNPLQLVGEKYEILPLFNFSKTKLIDNSIGIGIKILEQKKFLFFMPLNPRLGLIFCDESFSGGEEYFYIPPGDDRYARELNNMIVQFEHVYGNGFLFGQSKADLEEGIKLYKSLANLQENK